MKPFIPSLEKSKTNYRNFPMVPRVIYGLDSISQLGDILLTKRKNSEAPFIFLIDHFFEDQPLLNNIPLLFNDKVITIDTSSEPSTNQVDSIIRLLKEEFNQEPSGIVGIGGGSVLDLAKAVAVVYTQKKGSADYQGWDLLPHKGLYHLGIPTISGTGSEVSRTAVLSGPDRKLGINSDFTPFDQVILDPKLTETVPKEQWFFTGMDCFIHCVESLQGNFINAFSESHGQKAYDLCLEVFLGSIDNHKSREKLMMASWHGGMSIAYSQVGIAHALSYGLGHVLGIKHGIGNCLVFNHLSEYYPEGVGIFKKMLQHQNIMLPKNVLKEINSSQMDEMVSTALSMEPLWINALGPDWKKTINRNKVEQLYKQI